MVAGVRGSILMIKTALILLLLSSRLLGGDTYYQPYYYPYNNNKVNVINRIEHLYALGKLEPDPATEAALQKQWDAMAGAIPIAPAKSKFKPFAFRQNMPIVAPQRVAQSASVQTITATKTYTGYIQQSVFTRSDGTVTFTQESTETR